MGDRDRYVLASGITPSGVVHFGNFREVVTVDLVARALLDRGKKVASSSAGTTTTLSARSPRTSPTPKGSVRSSTVRSSTPRTPPGGPGAMRSITNAPSKGSSTGWASGWSPSYQARKYRAGEYAQGIRKALEKRTAIREILNRHRKDPHGEGYVPVSVYCGGCGTDHRIEDKGLGTGKGSPTTAETAAMRRPRIPTPVPASSSPGGSTGRCAGRTRRSTSSPEARTTPPTGDPWPPPRRSSASSATPPRSICSNDFVSVKGGGGKMSSSEGGVVTVDDILEIHTPEMIRWIFARTKTNVDFSIGLGLDVIKTYEDFDRQERLAYPAGGGKSQEGRHGPKNLRALPAGPRPPRFPRSGTPLSSGIQAPDQHPADQRGGTWRPPASTTAPT